MIDDSGDWTSPARRIHHAALLLPELAPLGPAYGCNCLNINDVSSDDSVLSHEHRRLLKRPHSMLHQNAEIITSTGRPRSRCSVSAQTLLADVAKDYIDSPHAYLIVEDEHGAPLGVIGIDDIRQRLDSTNFC